MSLQSSHVRKSLILDHLYLITRLNSWNHNKLKTNIICTMFSGEIQKNSLHVIFINSFHMLHVLSNRYLEEWKTAKQRNVNPQRQNNCMKVVWIKTKKEQFNFNLSMNVCTHWTMDIMYFKYKFSNYLCQSWFLNNNLDAGFWFFVLIEWFFFPRWKSRRGSNRIRSIRRIQGVREDTPKFLLITPLFFHSHHFLVLWKFEKRW